MSRVWGTGLGRCARGEGGGEVRHAAGLGVGRGAQGGGGGGRGRPQGSLPLSRRRQHKPSAHEPTDTILSSQAASVVRTCVQGRTHRRRDAEVLQRLHVDADVQVLYELRRVHARERALQLHRRCKGSSGGGLGRCLRVWVYVCVGGEGVGVCVWDTWCKHPNMCCCSAAEAPQGAERRGID